MTATADDVARVYRAEFGRAVAVLTRVLGDLAFAEDAVQDAFVEAARRWPDDGLPPSPAGWIITTARRRALDRVRRDSTREARHLESDLLRAPDDTLRRMLEDSPVDDDRLRLIFTCCHPALAPEARVALTLRLLGGLDTPQIARAFLVPEATVAQRIVRAKKKIRDTGIPFRVPRPADLPERVASVLAVLYLVHTEAHHASDGDSLTRVDLGHEALRLARLLVELMPDEPEALGLLALMLFGESRRESRTGPDGELVPLARQDRTQWNAGLVAEARTLVRACLRRDEPGPYQVQAAINAVHADAPTWADTDWRQVVALYDQLMEVAPGPVVALGRAVAVAELDGPAVALALIDGPGIAGLDGYHAFHVARAEQLRALDRPDDARLAYDAALALVTNTTERAHLQARRADLSVPRR